MPIAVLTTVLQVNVGRPVTACPAGQSHMQRNDDVSRTDDIIVQHAAAAPWSPPAPERARLYLPQTLFPFAQRKLPRR